MPHQHPEGEQASGLEPTFGPEHAATPDPLEPTLGSLREALHDAEARHPVSRRLAALLRLGHLKDARALPALLAASEDADWHLRKYAVSGLGRLGQATGLPAVAARLDDPRPEVRRAAARALRHVDDGQSLSRWASLRKDADWQVRAAAFEGLRRYPGPTTSAWLLEGLNDAVWLNRYTALQGLASPASEEVRRVLSSRLAHDRELAPWLAEALAGCGEAALPELLSQLENAPPWRKLAVAQALGAIDDPRARKALAGLIGHADAEIEAAIAQQGPAMAHVVLERLADEDWVVRWHACRLAGQLGLSEAGVAMLPLLDDPRRDVQLAALEALKELPDPRAEVDLQRALGAESWHLRLAAVEALAALGTPGAIKTLVWCLSDVRSEVRLAARRGLLAIGEAAEDALVVGLMDNPDTYEEIAWILKAIRVRADNVS
jgi:HEAT repeat protein